jgi:ubiquinol-cytochrome c reductase cytochrome b subunit
VKIVLDWLDDRTGYRDVLRHSLEEPVPGGASFAYVFGSVLTFVLLLQMTTGVFLAMYYSPSATDAWASVAFIQDTVSFGWFIRGLHSYGASAMVILAGLHLLQTGLYGAYKKPREMNWIVGILMLGLILAFALTGYLLPWDQTGYWATKVATGIAGTSPVIGGQLQQVVQGGNEYGNLTLTRFFAIHVFILPGVLIALLVAHVALFRRHGVTPKWGRTKAELDRDTEPFWPDQLFKDMVAIALAFAALIAVNVYTHGVKLDAPADPASNFDARPEWYFRALFQLLKYFEGTMEHVVALGMPVVVGAVLLGLPFVDRGSDRSPRARAPFLGVLGLGAVAVVLLTVISFREDASDPQLQQRLVQAEEQAAQARELARTHGVPPGGGTSVFTTTPHYRAKKLWAEHCAACHQGDEREGPEIGPGYNSRAWIRDFLKNPDGPRFFGMMDWNQDSRMPAVQAEGEELDALVELVYAQTGAADADQALAGKGQTLFDEGDCSDCHERDGTTDGSAPNLGGRGSIDALAAFIADAGQPHLFGELNKMPKFGRPKLSEDDRYALAEYLDWLRAATPAQPAAQ